ncbi:MAG TPA: glycosyl hydrolase family 8 [Polyangiaceae bacterium]|nr:glycosyl hydrolase family 8 [Polyangiaceae bacterium]
MPTIPRSPIHRGTFVAALRCAPLGLALACGSDEPEDVPVAIESEAALSMSAAAGVTPDQLLLTLLAAEGSTPSSGTRNLFSTDVGRSADEVREKLATAANRFFGIGTGETNELITDQGYRLYYELPQDPSQAFIWAPDSADIRSEGMSYGMMIAVQLGLREHFDRLWNFARKQMQYPAGSGAWANYFKWQGRVDGSSTRSWKVTYNADTVPAPDGEEYFAAALYLADRRWGSDGAINYRQAADAIAQSMLDNPAGLGRFPIIHAESGMVVFVPFGRSNEFSDPSYHLPAFYELYAEYADEATAARWRAIAETSRQYFVDSAHPTTGLHPDYANFDGTPNAGSNPGDQRHDEFRYDAWRVVMNMAVDYAWGNEDARLKTQVEKYHTFFADHLGQGNVSNALFAIDGSNPEGGSSTALTATLASGALASESAMRTRYIQNAWDVGQQSGLYRYYQECVYLLGLLATAGQYGNEWGTPSGG